MKRLNYVYFAVAACLAVWVTTRVSRNVQEQEDVNRLWSSAFEQLGTDIGGQPNVKGFDKWQSAARALYESDAAWDFEQHGAKLEAALAACSPEKAARIQELIALSGGSPENIDQELELVDRHRELQVSLRTPGAANQLVDSDRALIELAAISSKAFLPLAIDAGELSLRIELPQEVSQIVELRDLVPRLDVSMYLHVHRAVLSEAALALLEERPQDALDLACTAFDMAAVLQGLRFNFAHLCTVLMLGDALAVVESTLAMYPDLTDSSRLAAALSTFEPQVNLKNAIEGDRESMNLIFDWAQRSVRRSGAGGPRKTLASALAFFENDRDYYNREIDAILHALTLEWPASDEAIREAIAPLWENDYRRQISSMLMPTYGGSSESTIGITTRLRLVKLSLRANRVGLDIALADRELNHDPFTGERFLLEESASGNPVLSSPGPNGEHERSGPSLGYPSDWTDDIQITLNAN